MKTHTQQQTNQNTETIATEQKLRHQKRQEYKPQKWRGNTLVPVIIALAISAIATVAFLNQGADLSEKNKIILAQNEIATVLSEWVVSREGTGGANAGTTTVIPSTKGVINFGELSSKIANTNTLFKTDIVVSTRYLTYPTSSLTNCVALKNRFKDTMDGVGSVHCINNTDPEASNVAAGKILVIMLD